MENGFLNEFCKRMLESEFQLIFSGDKMQKAKLIFVQTFGPIFYIVTVQNGVLAAQEKEGLSFLLDKIQKKKSQYGCTEVVHLNVHLEKEYQMEEKERFLGEAIHTVHWYIDFEEKKVIVPKGYPDKLLNLYEICTASFSKTGEKEAFDPLKAAKTAQIQLEKKSSNWYMTALLIGVLFLLYLILFLTGKEEAAIYLFGDSRQAVLGRGEVYRIFTSMFLHGGFAHVSFNCFSLYIFGSRVEKYYGKGPFVLLYFLSGLGGSIFSILFSDVLSVGASGCIYGLIGSVYYLSKKERKSVDGLNSITMLLYILLGIGLGFLETGVDNAAHIGGLFTGIAVSYFLLRKRTSLKRST